MADVNLNTRISLKYDHYNNWATNNPVLLAGEVALVYIPENTTLAEGGVNVTGATPPQVMMKVGDGTSHYNDLKFVQAVAADVSAWAKAASKPVYAANEITGLTDYINTTIVDTDTQYTLVKVSDYQYQIKSKAKGDTEFATVVGTIDIPQYNDTALTGRVADLEAAVEALEADYLTSADKTELEGKITEVSTAVATEKSRAEGVEAGFETRIAAIEGAYETKANVEALGTEVKGLINTEKSRAEGAEQAISGELTAYKTSNDARVLAAEGEIDALQTTILGLSGAMHFKGVVDAVPADGAEGYESGDVVLVKADAEANARKEFVYDGTTWHELGDEGSYLTKTAAAETYQTKADAALEHTALEGLVSTEKSRAEGVEAGFETRIATIEGAYETKANVEALGNEVKGLITAEETRAKGVEGGFETRIAAIEGAYENKTDSAAKLAEAKKHADDLNTAMDGRVAAIEAKPAMDITADDIAAYDGAVTAAGTAVQNVVAGDGLTATKGTDNVVTIGFDANTTFVFNCGTSSI